MNTNKKLLSLVIASIITGTVGCGGSDSSTPASTTTTTTGTSTTGTLTLTNDNIYTLAAGFPGT